MTEYEYIEKETVKKYCEANKAIAERDIAEWLAHNEKYREKITIPYSFQRKRDMEDCLLWLEHTAAADVALVRRGKWDMRTGIPHCPFCGNAPAWWGQKYCGYCGARMEE